VFLVLLLFLFSTLIPIGLSYQDKEDSNDEIMLTQWTGSYYIRATYDNASCQLICHIPVIHLHQTPVMITKVLSEPEGKVDGYHISQNYSGSNALLVVDLVELPFNQKVNVFFNVSTIIKSDDYDDLPKELPITSVESLPDETKEWLTPSEFIQSDHWRINLLASLLNGFNDNLIKTTNRVSIYTGKIIRYLGGFPQDALTTLKHHFAVCTGKANLAAALLRSNDIPARILMVFPTHYIVEYYAHPYGWVRSETTQGKMPCPTQAYTVSFCAYPEDETVSNVVNGCSPYAGVIAYWGSSNDQVEWGIEYTKWKYLDDYSVSVSNEVLDQTFSLTQQGYRYFMNYTGASLTPTQGMHYSDAVSFQNMALSSFKEHDLQGYIDNMHSACDCFAQI
jgi:hypothetical protein